MKKCLFDIAVIICIAVTLPFLALWTGFVAIWYTLYTVPGRLLDIANKYYYSTSSE